MQSRPNFPALYQPPMRFKCLNVSHAQSHIGSNLPTSRPGLNKGMFLFLPLDPCHEIKLMWLLPYNVSHDA